MKDCWFFDNNFNGVSDEVFDNVVGFFDFPLDDVEDDVVEEDWDAQLKNLEEPSLGVFSVASSGPRDKTENKKPKLGRRSSASPAVTARRTYGKTIPKNVSFNGKDAHQFHTYSPVSVFESSSSSPVENSNFDLPVIPVKRPRRKRQRLSSFSLLFSTPFISNSPAFWKDERTDVSESDLQAKPAGKLLNRVKKQAKTDLSQLPDPTKKISLSQESDSARKCMHCEVTKTPQWREGPMGPKTLCNACGVRYRSGRLFPEYRPAASPTFIPSLHSNSHKKVIAMRSGAAQKPIMGLSSSPNLPGNPL